ncbi:MAG: hypothetical protein WC829_07000 [Hyphomicrobium sp.]|jgi:NTP pyrophosphatase (non-canonical NTP hydrolase)
MTDDAEEYFANTTNHLSPAELAAHEMQQRAKYPGYFGNMVARAIAAAAKASEKFPQPNYVVLKIAEEAGEVVRAAIHYGEGRMPWDEVEDEIIQLLAMLIRFVSEGDEVNGIIPPHIEDINPGQSTFFKAPKMEDTLCIRRAQGVPDMWVLQHVPSGKVGIFTDEEIGDVRRYIDAHHGSSLDPSVLFDDAVHRYGEQRET